MRTFLKRALISALLALTASTAVAQPRAKRAGGQPRRRLPMEVIRHQGSAHGYLVVDPKTREAIVVDAPSGAADALLPEAAELGATVKAIVLTHTHGDHVVDLARLHRETGAPIALFGGDGPDVGEIRVGGVRVPTMNLRHGAPLRLGRIKLEAFHTPGHTLDSLILAGNGVVFTGDTVQAGALGGDARSPTFLRSLRLIAEQPADAALLAGHGVPTTVGAEAGWIRSMLEESGRE